MRILTSACLVIHLKWQCVMMIMMMMIITIVRIMLLISFEEWCPFSSLEQIHCITRPLESNSHNYYRLRRATPRQRRLFIIRRSNARMYRLRSSVSYDILHGIHFPPNMSSMFAYLSYFPPPPPVLPGPPPPRSWTCAARSSSSSSSCLVSDDRNPPSLRSFVPSLVHNQSGLLHNASHFSKIPSTAPQSPSVWDSIVDFFQHQFTLILLVIIFLSIFIFVILLLLCFLYLRRLRQRSSSANNFRETNNNNTESIPPSQHSKNKKFYHSLIPYRRKYQKRTATPTLTNANEDNNLLRVTNHDSSVLEVICLSQNTATHINDDEEQEEEAL